MNLATADFRKLACRYYDLTCSCDKMSLPGFLLLQVVVKSAVLAYFLTVLVAILVCGACPGGASRKLMTLLKTQHTFKPATINWTRERKHNRPSFIHLLLLIMDLTDAYM